MLSLHYKNILFVYDSDESSSDDDLETDGPLPRRPSIAPTLNSIQQERSQIDVILSVEKNKNGYERSILAKHSSLVKVDYIEDYKHFVNQLKLEEFSTKFSDSLTDAMLTLWINLRQSYNPNCSSAVENFITHNNSLHLYCQLRLNESELHDFSCELKDETLRQRLSYTVCRQSELKSCIKKDVKKMIDSFKNEKITKQSLCSTSNHDRIEEILNNSSMQDELQPQSWFDQFFSLICCTKQCGDRSHD